IPVALAIALFVYLAIATASLLAVGSEALAGSDTPVLTAVEAGSIEWIAPLVVAGAAIASIGVLLSLLAGLSRTVFAMSSGRHLPAWLNAVQPQTRVPYRAEMAVAVSVGILVAVVDLRDAIGFSSFAVLIYYAIANASAYTLGAEERRWPRWLTAAGAVGCLVLAVTLPLGSVVIGACLILLFTVFYAVAIWRPPGGVL
ncbi:MAG TPA: amino acid permease, partial [Dehalococcoidia bacterium]|nr:amino acid permease [Dehalococcoidia bacterium]